MTSDVLEKHCVRIEHQPVLEAILHLCVRYHCNVTECAVCTADARDCGHRESIQSLAPVSPSRALQGNSRSYRPDDLKPRTQIDASMLPFGIARASPDCHLLLTVLEDLVAASFCSLNATGRSPPAQIS
jgi:hypothetical protein